MRRLLSFLPLLLISLLAFIMLAFPGRARADDGIFPPAPAAKPFIDFDGRGFLIRGKRTFLVSGSMHYSRVPRALWRDRLLRIKRAGFNTIETYAFWNFHEAHEGRWDFSGDHDLDAYLKLIKELGMYAVVRVGPYVCAEWDSGGYPVWLRFKPGVRVREDNPQFESYVDAWYDHVIPIVARNQIHRGGAVLMVQLENEHPQGWGREMPNGYFRRLRDHALSLGLEVPYFFSGLNHGSDPAGDRPWDSVGRSNPWYTTEFWPGWYDLYGPLEAGRFTYFVRGTWKIIAYGGNGYNFYMLHGGTDFDTWNDDEVASSYDYGGAVGQAGDLRPIYYRFKRAALFARSFEEILENSTNSTAQNQGAVSSQNLRLTARTAPAGTLLFLDNRSRDAVRTRFSSETLSNLENGEISILPGEIRPIVLNYKLLPGISLDFAAARILGITQQQNVTTLMTYGKADSDFREDSSTLIFSTTDSVTNAEGLAILERKEHRVVMTPHFPITGANESWFKVGNRVVRVVSVSDETADHTWFIPVGAKNYLVIGPAYVGEAQEAGGHLHLAVERPLESSPESNATPPLIYGPDGAELKAQKVVFQAHDAVVVTLNPTATVPWTSSWQMRSGANEASEGYFTADWKPTQAPMSMGADGDTSAYAWYRAVLFVPRAGRYTLRFSDVGDRVLAFVNGKPAGNSPIRQRFDHPVPFALEVTLRTGANTLALLTTHYGRHKLFSYLGPIDHIDAKGISGPLTLSKQSLGDVVEVTHWRWKPSASGAAEAPQITAPDLGTRGIDWSDASPAQDVFHGRRGFAWYRLSLPNAPGPHRQLHFENVDDNATVWLNGKKLFNHTGWGQPFDVSLDSAWRSGGLNVLVVLVENTDGPGGIMGAVTLQSRSPGDEKPVLGWKMRGGIGDPADSHVVWSPYDGKTATSVPTFYRAEFVAPATTEETPILRLSTAGLSHGFVWLNGHNLGRYPEKVPVNGLYLPECWMQTGTNTVVIFDEEGRTPDPAKLIVERAASRITTEWTADAK